MEKEEVVIAPAMDGNRIEEEKKKKKINKGLIIIICVLAFIVLAVCFAIFVPPLLKID